MVEVVEVEELFGVVFVDEEVPFGRGATDDVVEEAEGCRVWGRWLAEDEDPGVLLFGRVEVFVGVDLDDGEGLEPF